MVAQTDIYTLNLPWDELPLNLLEDNQKLHFRQHVQISRHTTEEVLWSAATCWKCAPGTSERNLRLETGKISFTNYFHLEDAPDRKLLMLTTKISSGK